MKWRVGVFTLIMPILALQVVLFLLFYLNLATVPAGMDGAAADIGDQGLRYDTVKIVRRQNEHLVSEGSSSTQADSPSLQRGIFVASTTVSSVNLLETSIEVSKDQRQALASNSMSELKEKSFLQTDVADRKTSASYPRTLRTEANLSYFKLADFKDAAEKERLVTLLRMGKRRKESKQQAEKERLRIRYENRQRLAEDKAWEDEQEQHKKKQLKSIPQRERERAEKLRLLLLERTKSSRVKDIDMRGNFELAFEDDPLSVSMSEYFREVCELAVEPLVECSSPRQHIGMETIQASGEDIMFTVRTTVKYHETRLPVLLETWLGEVEPISVFIVTDGEDEDLAWKIRTLNMNYVNIQTGQSHDMNDLCCKAGVELDLLFSPENSKFNWLCHVDDDMYVNIKPLVDTLSRFDPTRDKVYLGRSGSSWSDPRIVKAESLIGTPGKPYHFAVGGMYCLSRSLLEISKDYIVGCSIFQESCTKAQEPEDVTVGLVVGVVLGLELYRTEMIFSHGLDLLSSTNGGNLKDQIAFSYGYGADGLRNIVPNVIHVPGGLFNIDEDVTQFKSIHCYIHPKIQWCLDMKRQLIEEMKIRLEGNIKECVCSWKMFICCRVYKENYINYVMAKMDEAKLLRENEKQEQEKQEKNNQKDS